MKKNSVSQGTRQLPKSQRTKPPSLFATICYNNFRARQKDNNVKPLTFYRDERYDDFTTKEEYSFDIIDALRISYIPDKYPQIYADFTRM